ncbi:MAG: helix-turn-helix domain-containing protein [Patescibacteria group bacterium]
MKEDKIIKELMELGLEEKEAGIYLASLVLGATTILKLSNQSGINRTTAYEIIESLERKGLMKKEIHGLKTLYSPEPPERLENTLETKRSLLAKILPELDGKYYLKSTGSSIKYYEGLTAIKNVYNDIIKDLKPRDFYYCISNTALWQNLEDDYFMKNHVEKFTYMREINRRLLFVDSPEAKRRKETEKNFNEKVRLLPKNSNIHTDMVITPYKIVTFQLHEPYVALVVENKTMIETQKEIFGLLWDKNE